MKKNRGFICKVFLLAGLFSLVTCSTTSHLEIRTDLNKKPKLPLDQFDEIRITDFLEKEETAEFDINKEIKDYFAQEIKVRTEQKVNLDTISPDNENRFEDKDFWVRSSDKEKKGVYFTGSIEYKAEVRKALIKDKKKFEDPFQEEDRFVQRKQYSLLFNLYMIDSQSGEVLYKRTFNETKSYENPNQTAYFAFYDLIYGVKEKIFRDVFKVKTLQRRYLLIR
ncbi:MAG: hypothetical protein GF421_02680 [Candidatus Aminicenantes bacterium]|nr:hypothetical protein [Candidatus Aminicenantes bacterium]